MEYKCIKCLCNNCKIGCEYPCNSCSFDEYDTPIEECENFEDSEGEQ